MLESLSRYCSLNRTASAPNWPGVYGLLASALCMFQCGSKNTALTRTRKQKRLEVQSFFFARGKKKGIPTRKSPLRAAFELQMLRQQQEEDLSLNKMKTFEGDGQGSPYSKECQRGDKGRNSETR
ncbi:hypothetical protein J6590_100466 [Homalodisca vitripennis]|nr:hypothetical protein J6590_100466 [Homalodisca vitripennis]